MKTSTLDTPLGTLRVSVSERGLVGIYYPDHKPAPRHLQDEIRSATADERAWFEATARQLGEYFAGARTVFDLPLDLRGTEFQKRVWRSLTEIPFGETRSYGDIARRIGNPAAVRAVGAANGRNPISIVVPCHRVIGSDGSATGYAGGLESKRWLLALERDGRSATPTFAPAAGSHACPP